MLNSPETSFSTSFSPSPHHHVSLYHKGNHIKIENSRFSFFHIFSSTLTDSVHYYIILEATAHRGLGLPTDSWPHIHLSTDRVDDHPARLEIMCGQYVMVNRRCWFSRPELQLRINSYSNTSWCWFRTNPMLLTKNLFPLRSYQPMTSK